MPAERLPLLDQAEAIMEQDQSLLVEYQSLRTIRGRLNPKQLR